MGFAERRGLQVAGHHGGVDVVIVRRIADGDGQVAGVEFDVFVAGNSLDREVSGRHADKEHGRARDFDRYLQIVLGAARDAEIPVIAGATEANGEVASVIGITPIDVDGDPIVVAAHHSEFTRTQVQAQIAPGGEVDREGWF